MATIKGTNDKDTLLGTEGKDMIWGLKGKDKITGGMGNDKMWGGDEGKPDKDADTFIFGKGGTGKDVIMDFDVKKDVLEFTKGVGGIKKVSDVLKHADQVGKDVVIDLGDGNKITLKKVDLDDLKKNPGKHFDVVKDTGE